ncbi:MAG: nodulation protein NfeD [Dehalococcoidales bacterium]|nr:nodulation protein NfeD [Dehalococcoidales bacterium]
MKILRLFTLVGLLITSFFAVTGVEADSPTVAVLDVKGIINPVTADYISRGIQEAESSNAVVCVIQLDTPGGLDTSMRDIVQDIVNAKIPVVVYVSPSGARAASAGVFITVSAHIAAMSPNTAIGAASPVSISSSGEEDISDTMKEKVFNDAAAYIRSLAGTHGRNVDWAEKAVREAVSATETEALELKVVDVIAPDLNSLLLQINGREVTLSNGAKVILNTASAAVNPLKMTAMEQFLLAISDPNIAFTLMGLASIGLFVEITNPGLIFPGVIGAISLIFSLFALGNLPVNIAGILLIVLAFVLFIVEAVTPATFGALTAGGIASMIVGGLILFKGGPLFNVDIWLIVIFAVCIGALFAFIISRIVKAHHLQATTGMEELIGSEAVVRTMLNPEGTVFFKGELWGAVSEAGNIEPGEAVTIKKIEGLKLFVIKKEGGK